MEKKTALNTIVGVALFAAGYLTSTLQRGVEPDYLFHFSVPTEEGTLDGLIADTGFPLGRTQFFIEVGDGIAYVDSDKFRAQYGDYLDRIGYSKGREWYVRRGAVNSFLDAPYAFRVNEGGVWRPKTSLDRDNQQ